MKGEAYIFRRRSGAMGNGHLGWGFLLDPAQQLYCFGSTENTSGHPYVNPGGDNGAWVATGNFIAMLQKMQTGFKTGLGYDDYKSVPVEPINPQLAQKTAENKKKEGYKVSGSNCADHAYSILTAYGVKGLPPLQACPQPNSWFDLLYGWTYFDTFVNKRKIFANSVKSEEFAEDIIQSEKTTKKPLINRTKIKFTSENTDAVQEQLDNNKLFAALMMVSLPDAFKYLGFDHKTSDFDVSAPTKDEATLIRSLVKSLESGETGLSEPFVLQEVSASGILQPPAPQYKYQRYPDIVRKISIAALEHGLETHVKKNFRGEQFDFPARDWWTLTARGDQLALHLSSERAQITATFECTLEFDFYLDSENYTFETDLPLELSILAAFVHDEEESEFYLSIRKGQISITNAVYPNGLISELVEMISESIVPHIPISGVPVDFDFPDTQGYGEPEAKLMLSGVTVDDLYINLDFHIKSNFLPSRKSSAASTERIGATNEEPHFAASFQSSQNSENFSQDTVYDSEYSGEAGGVITDTPSSGASVIETAASVFGTVQGNPLPESVVMQEGYDWGILNFPPGVRGHIKPLTYSMRYLNGEQTYTERFALITCSKEYVVAAGTSVSSAVHQLSAQVATIPYVGIALAAIMEVGAHWYSAASLNSDGSLTLQFAYHYCGTKAGGIDLTASPVPGVDPKSWFSVVNNLMRGIKSLSPHEE